MAVGVVRLHPFTLEFICKDVEESYKAFRSKTLLVTDLFFLRMSLVLHAWFTIALFLEIVPCLNKRLSVVVSLLASSVVVFQWMVMWALGQSVWLQHRTVLLSLFRLSRLFVFSYGVAMWFPGGAGSWGLLLKGVVLGSGSLKPTWLAFGMPLHFKHHWVVQTVSAVFIGFSTQRAVLETAIKQGDMLIQRVWR